MNKRIMHLAILFEWTGYGILLYNNWPAAIGVFCVMAAHVAHVHLIKE